MNLALTHHPLSWVTPGPLWPAAAGTGTDPVTDAQRDAMARPALLRFHSDRFMDDLATALAVDAASLQAFRALPVSHRRRAPGREAEGPAALDVLKLYQPIHGDFSLVAASLVCPRPGLPEHAVHPEKNERATFVLRRLADGVEHAWSADPKASQGRSWQAISAADVDAVAPNEDLLPMFPMAYADGDGRDRRLWVGLVPTSSAETMRNTGTFSVDPTSPTGTTTPTPSVPVPLDSRLVQFRQRVTEPLAGLKANTQTSAEAVRGRRMASLFLLLDLMDLVRLHRPADFAAITSGAASADAFFPASVHGTAGPGISWPQALRHAWGQRDAAFGEVDADPVANVDLAGRTLDGNQLYEWFRTGLPAMPAPTAASEAAAASAAASGEPDPTVGPASAALPKYDTRGLSRYVIRCVYLRPNCEPLETPLVSGPTEEFRIAGFFDVDAPARTFHIAMPVDTAVKDLRQFRRNVSFALSDQLRAQMSRVSEMKDLVKGDIEDGEPLDVGMLCSMSIPIISICALILLMIMVQLLNLIFWWQPFFKFCFPILLKAKR